MHLISIVISLLIFMIDVQFEVTCFGPPSSTLSTCPIWRTALKLLIVANE